MRRTIKKILKEIILENSYQRDFIDSEYADEYPKYKNMLISAIKSDIRYKGENEKSILLFDHDKKVVIDYIKESKVLYYDYEFSEDIENMIPWHIFNRHFKNAVFDFFKETFSDVHINRVRGANITYF